MHGPLKWAYAEPLHSAVRSPGPPGCVGTDKVVVYSTDVSGVGPVASKPMVSPVFHDLRSPNSARLKAFLAVVFCIPGWSSRARCLPIRRHLIGSRIARRCPSGLLTYAFSSRSSDVCRRYFRAITMDFYGHGLSRGVGGRGGLQTDGRRCAYAASIGRFVFYATFTCPVTHVIAHLWTIPGAPGLCHSVVAPACSFYVRWCPLL